MSTPTPQHKYTHPWGGKCSLYRVYVHCCLAWLVNNLNCNCIRLSAWSWPSDPLLAVSALFNHSTRPAGEGQWTRSKKLPNFWDSKSQSSEKQTLAKYSQTWEQYSILISILSAEDFYPCLLRKYILFVHSWEDHSSKPIHSAHVWDCTSRARPTRTALVARIVSSVACRRECKWPRCWKETID